MGGGHEWGVDIDRDGAGSGTDIDKVSFSLPSSCR